MQPGYETIYSLCENVSSVLDSFGGRRSECRTGGMPNAFLGGMPTGRNADSYCPISGVMPKTRGSRNESVSVAKISSASGRVRERLLYSLRLYLFRVYNKTWKEYTYGTPIHVYAPRMKVIQTWVFRRCTLPQNLGPSLNHHGLRTTRETKPAVCSPNDILNRRGRSKSTL